MNIASSSSPLPTAVRSDAAQDPTRVTLGPDSDCVDPAGMPDDGTRDFGRMLSQSIAKDAGGPIADRGDRDTRAVDATGGRPDAATPFVPDATAVKGATATTSADAADTKPAADSPVADDLAAQLALVSQWAALATPIASQATGRIVPSTEGTDVDAKIDTARGGKGGAPIDPATMGARPDAGQAAAETADTKAAADASMRDTRTASAAASDRVDARAAVAPFAIAGAAQALERSMRPAAPSATTIAATAKSDAKESVRSTSADADPMRPATTTPIERLFTMAAAVEPAANAGTPAGDQAATVNAFATQVAAQVSNAASAPTSAPAATSIVLHEQVGTSAWSHEVGHAALRMAANDLQNVSLHLNPEHLGPVEVQMRLDQGIANVQFTAAHAETRQALESSRTTLDQMFTAQGLKLGDCSVGQQSANASSFARDFGAASQGGGRQGNARDAGPGDDAVVTATIGTRATRAVGLVDTFA